MIIRGYLKVMMALLATLLVAKPGTTQTQKLTCGITEEDNKERDEGTYKSCIYFSTSYKFGFYPNV